jgi:hypothetical protein
MVSIFVRVLRFYYGTLIFTATTAAQLLEATIILTLAGKYVQFPVIFHNYQLYTVTVTYTLYNKATRGLNAWGFPFLLDIYYALSAF